MSMWNKCLERFTKVVVVCVCICVHTLCVHQYVHVCAVYLRACTQAYVCMFKCDCMCVHHMCVCLIH